MEHPAQNLDEFKAKLDLHYIWPCSYPFKFILKQENVAVLQNLLPQEQFILKTSAKGNYVSMTLEKEMNSSADVLAIYALVQEVPTLIAL